MIFTVDVAKIELVAKVNMDFIMAIKLTYHRRKEEAVDVWIYMDISFPAVSWVHVDM